MDNVQRLNICAQEIFYLFFFNPKSPQLCLTLSQMNIIYILTPHFFKMNFGSILALRPT
jgi:hypothetical protein